MNPLALSGIGFTVLAAIIVLIHAVKGYKNEGKKALSRLALIVLTAAVALLASKIVVSVAYDPAMNVVKSSVENFDLEELRAAIPSFDEIAQGLLSMAIVPFIFLIFYLILRPILALLLGWLFKAIFSLIPGMKKKKSLAGLVLGIVCGLLIVVILYTPFVGTQKIAAQAARGMISSAEDEESKALLESISDADKMLSVKVVDAIGGKLLYRMLTTVKIDGAFTDLSAETANLIPAVNDVMSISDVPIAEYGAKEKATIESLTQSVNSSLLVKTIAAEGISAVATAWEKGETFLGMEAPAIAKDNDYKDLMTALFSALKSMNRESLADDLDCLSFVLGRCIDEGMFAELAKDSGSMIDVIARPGFLSSVLAKLYGNEHMASLIPALTNFGLQSVAKSLGIPANAEEVYDSMMNAMASSLNTILATDATNDEKAVALKAALLEASRKYGASFDENTLNMIAPTMILYFEGEANLTGADVAAFFAAVNDAAQATPAAVAFAGGTIGIKFLAEENEPTPKQKELAAMVAAAMKNGSEMPAEMKVQFASTAAAYKPAEAENAKKALSNVGDKTKFETKTVTLADLSANSVDFTKMTEEEKKKEAENMEKLLSTANEILGDLQGGNTDMTTIGKAMSKVGTMLESLDNTALLGGEASTNLLKAIVSSETVSGVTGWSAEEAMNVAESLKGDGKSGYAEVFDGVGECLAYVNVITGENVTIEERAEALKNLFKSLTSGAVNAIRSAVTESTLTKLGATEETAKAAVTVIHSLLANVVNFKETAGEEAFNREIDAIDSLVQVALKSGESTMTANDYIDMVLNSSIVVNTVNEICYGETGKVLVSLTGAMPQNVWDEYAEAVEAYASNHELTAEQTKAFNGISTMFGYEEILK